MTIFLTKQKQGNQMLVELGLSPSSCKLYDYFYRKLKLSALGYLVIQQHYLKSSFFLLRSLSWQLLSTC